MKRCAACGKKMTTWQNPPPFCVECRAWAEAEVRPVERDIVDVLTEAGYDTVEGADAVREALGTDGTVPDDMGPWTGGTSPVEPEP
jgi:hypothetical protein